MSIVAASRTSSLDFPLFVHVLGAMILVGGTLAGATVLTLARGDTRSLRLGYWSLLTVALPGYLIMRIGAEWIYSKEHLGDLPDDPTWVGIGYADRGHRCARAPARTHFRRDRHAAYARRTRARAS